MSWVLKNCSHLKASEWIVAMILADHANADGGHSFPSERKIEKESPLTRKTVQTAIQGLIDQGIVERESEPTRTTPAVYRFPAFKAGGVMATPRIEKEGGVIDDDSGVTVTPGWRNSDATGGVTITPKPSLEPSSNRQEPSPRDPPKTT
jgi:hypothetical protein